MKSYLDSKNKEYCSACEACASVCHVSAIKFKEDDAGFRYPVINSNVCTGCNVCRNVCIYDNRLHTNNIKQMVFGGYNKDKEVRNKSTSGGAFSALADAWCDKNYVIFGAAADRLKIYHTFISDKSQIDIFRGSKYSQSHIGDSYKKVKEFIISGKKVLFSGTPCQIEGLYNFLSNYASANNLLAIEVVCEGFPSPVLLNKYTSELERKYKSKVASLDYRYKDKNKWDFQVMKITFDNGKIIKRDRWFSPFWIFWSQRLMSRPSCISCMFRTPGRVADITLGDLWGVHKYCPELYGNNGGSSLIVCNSRKGIEVFNKAKENLWGHNLKYKDVLEYQRPMRVVVPASPRRNYFLKDLKRLSYTELCKKWKPHHSFKFLISKYIWGTNRQIVTIWKIKNLLKNKKINWQKK